MTADHPAWTQVGEDRVVHEGWLRIVSRTYAMPDGRTSDWELLGGFESVAILPITPAGKIVMVRQFRPGPGLVKVNLPGGLLDPGESPETAAARELLEETGYEAGSVELAVSFHAMAHSGWVKHVVIARDCTPTGTQQLDDVEDCVPFELTPAGVRSAARAGELVGTDTVYLGLDHAGLL